MEHFIRSWSHFVDIFRLKLTKSSQHSKGLARIVPCHQSCGTEAGSYLRLIDSCITQLKVQGPSRTCNEKQKRKKGSKENSTLSPWPRPPSLMQREPSIDFHMPCVGVGIQLLFLNSSPRWFSGTYINVQWFRSGFAVKAHRLCIIHLWA